MMQLENGEKTMMIFSAVLTQTTSVTDRHANRRTTGLL